MAKPAKITTTSLELFRIIEQKIKSGQYIFTNHAKQRRVERGVSEVEVLNILEGVKGYTRRWNKAKDRYESAHYSGEETWRYCIEGKTPDGDVVRIIITFYEDKMPIITVIKI